MSEPAIVQYIQRRLQQNSGQPQHYPFLTRFELLDDRECEQLQVYKLHSLAKVEFDLLDVYHLFFADPRPERIRKLRLKCGQLVQERQRAKKFLQQVCKERYQIGLFMEELIAVVCLRSILFHDGLDKSQSKSLVKQAIRNNKLQPIQLQPEQVSQNVNSAYKQIDSLKCCQGQKITVDFEAAKEVYMRIHQKKAAFLRKLPAKWQEIIQKKYVPKQIAMMQPQHRLLFVNNQMQKICRIPAFLPAHKAAIINNMVRNYHRYAGFAYGAANPNYIVQTKREKEKEPVLLALPHYLNLTNEHYLQLQVKRKIADDQKRKKLQQKIARNTLKLQANLPKQQQQKLLRQRKQHQDKINSLEEQLFKLLLSERQSSVKKLRNQLVADLVQELRVCLRKTKFPYPSLNAQAVIFNQKTLRPQLSFTHLIIAELGLNNIASVELMLSNSPTPRPIQFEQSHLQRENKDQWWLNLKIFDLNAKGSEDIRLLQKIKKQREEIHVWRTICVSYFIKSESKHLTNAKYRQKYHPQRKQQEPIPFDLQKYNVLCRQLYQHWRKNPQQIAKLLQIEKSSIASTYQFDYTLEQFAKMLNLPAHQPDYPQAHGAKQDGQKTAQEIWKIKHSMSSVLVQLLQKEALKIKSPSKCKLVLSAVALDILNWLAWRGKERKFHQNQLKPKLQKFKQSYAAAAKQNFADNTELLQITKIKQEVQSSVAQNSMLGSAHHFSQKTRACIERLQKLVDKQIKPKQALDICLKLIKRKNQTHILASKIMLLLKVQQTIYPKNMLKYQTFVIPFAARDQKFDTFQQCQEIAARMAVALQIIEISSLQEESGKKQAINEHF